MPDIDQEFNYDGYHGVPSKCRLRVWSFGRMNTTVVVVLSDIALDSGTSVTNRIEHIATMVNKDVLIPKLGVDHDRAIWIQHHPNEEYRDDPEFELVTFDWEQVPRRKRYPSVESAYYHRAKHASWSYRRQEWVEELIKDVV
jgi:hypothetical protein